MDPDTTILRSRLWGKVRIVVQSCGDTQALIGEE
jgi:hypothetical protein